MDFCALTRSRSSLAPCSAMACAIAEQGAKLDRDLAKAQKSIEAARAMEANYKTFLKKKKVRKAPAHGVNDPGVRRNLGWAPSKPPQSKPYIDSEVR